MESEVLLVEPPLAGVLCYHCDTSTWQSLSLPPVKDYTTVLVTYLESSFRLEVTRSTCRCVRVG